MNTFRIHITTETLVEALRLIEVLHGAIKLWDDSYSFLTVYDDDRPEVPSVCVFASDKSEDEYREFLQDYLSRGSYSLLTKEETDAK